MDLYERDFYAWTREQAALARARSGNTLDWDNIAEELDDLGKQVRSELRSRYVVLLTHLLKWLYQAERRSRSWTNTINEQRDQIREHVSQNPSLKSADAEIFASAYRSARREASTETDLDVDVFPVEPPFTLAQALDDEFWPEPASDA